MNKTLKEILLSTFPFHLAVLFMLFLKLTGLKDMSWWWVFAPYWFVFLFLIVVVILIGLGLFVLKTIVYIFLGRKQAAETRFLVRNYPFPEKRPKTLKGGGKG
jgi:hypothetical protein